MRVRIHRGAHEVGGNCVEVEAADGTRIALDVGKPLTQAPGEPVALSFAGPLDAIFVSHPHLDHYGLVDLVTPTAPIYIGAEAERLLTAAAFFSPATQLLLAAGHLQDRRPVQVGSTTVTPYLVDHSGFDAYSMLVEADGKRLFYTGDFRGHGRKARLFEELLRDPPSHVDVLLCEGTQVGGVDRGARTETELEEELVNVCRATDGLVLVLGSAQNLDRVVTTFRAARRSGRTFVTDLYAATVAAATRPTIPQPGFDGYGVYVPRRQRVLVKESREFDRIEAIADIRVLVEHLASTGRGVVAYLPSSAVRELIAGGAATPDSAVLWSMWDGYLTEPSGERLRADLVTAGITLVSWHTSGHATIADIGRLIVALDPCEVVPIHTDAASEFLAMSERTRLQPDGIWWSV